MPAPSSTVPVAAATGSSPTNKDAGVLKYVQGFVSGGASLLQEIPAEVLPVVGTLCKTFLAFEQLVETAKSNGEALCVLRELCQVVIEGVLVARTNRPALQTEGFAKLKKHVDKAEEVAKLCSGGGVKKSVKRFVLARKISNDIAAIQNDVLAFCSVNNLVLADDTNANVSKLDTVMASTLEAMENERKATSYFRKMVLAGAVLATAVFASLLLKNLVSSVGLDRRIHQTTTDILVAVEEIRRDEHEVRALEEIRHRVAASNDVQKDLEALKEDIALKTKELADRDNELDTSDQISRDLEAALRTSKEALASMEIALEEQRRMTDLASRVKIPPGAPRIRDWYIEREIVIFKACDQLVFGRTTSDTSDQPRMVGLAGPSGSGKSTVASMVIAREDVRASFHKGVLWLQVGQGAEDHLPELMHRLAVMVYETVMLKGCRPPIKAGFGVDPEDGAAYIREVVDESSQRFLVVADDVWEIEVLKELKRAGAWVLYTTRQDELLLGSPLLRLDQVLKEEAEMVLRRAAELDDKVNLPEAAYELMERCEFVVLDLALVGRWSMIRGRHDSKVWRTALDRVVEMQKNGDGGQPLSWRGAVLHAGLEELACDNPQNKELYLALAVMPKGLAFPSEVTAMLLHGADYSTQDLAAAGKIASTLERWSILTLEGGGKYRVHDEHTDFLQRRLSANQDIRGRILPRWRSFISSVRALSAFSALQLVKIWDVFAAIEGRGVASKPYDAALDALGGPIHSDPIHGDLVNGDFGVAAQKAGEYHWARGDWFEAYTKLSQAMAVLGICGNSLIFAANQHSLGVSACMLGKTEEGERFLRRALAIREETLGVHLEVANTLHSLGNCAYGAEKIEEAEKFHRRALAIREKKQGVDHLDVANSLGNVAACLTRAGNTERAEELYRRQRAILEKKLGDDHAHVAVALHNMGVCAMYAGRMGDSEEYIRRSLMILTNTLGADHPEVAAALHNLGRSAGAAGRRADAENFYRRALTIREKHFAADHPLVEETQKKLADLGKLNLILALSKVAAAVVFGGLSLIVIVHARNRRKSIVVASILQNPRVCASDAARTNETEDFHRREVAIREGELGVNHHRDVTRTLNELVLAVCASNEGRAEEA